MKLVDTREPEGFGDAVRNYERRDQTGSKHRKQVAQSRGSRNSSLNYISDVMVDQLSMNFGKKNYKNYNNNNRLKLPSDHQNDSNSVASILTKGGTLVNPVVSRTHNHQ